MIHKMIVHVQNDAHVKWNLFEALSPLIRTKHHQTLNRHNHYTLIQSYRT